jgi:N-acylneuraminate cytidylyltransferase
MNTYSETDTSEIIASKRILALIPARAGSKRLPGKNIRPLGGKPLIVWSIDVLKNIPEICDILVTTDSADIARIAKDAGAMVPWLRPPELATDTASGVDVALHALDWYETAHGAVDGILLIQPTSPFRHRTTVLDGINIFIRNTEMPVIGVSPAASHPMWCFRVDGDQMVPFVDGGGLHLRSQDLPPAYAVNGAFYLATPGCLRDNRSFFAATMRPLRMDAPEESIDIDTDEDWIFAEMVIEKTCNTVEFPLRMQ